MTPDECCFTKRDLANIKTATWTCLTACLVTVLCFLGTLLIAFQDGLDGDKRRITQLETRLLAASAQLYQVEQVLNAGLLATQREQADLAKITALETQVKELEWWVARTLPTIQGTTDPNRLLVYQIRDLLETAHLLQCHLEPGRAWRPTWMIPRD